MVETYTLGGYAAIIAIAGGVYYLYKDKNRNGRNRSNRVEKSAATRRASETVKAVKKTAKSQIERAEAAVSTALEGNTSQDSEKKKNKSKKKQKTQASTSTTQDPPTTTAPSKIEIEDDSNNLEFAQRLAAAQKGVVPATKSAGSTKQKSVKQSKAATPQTNGTAGAQNISAPSSTTGADGDDDLSPVNSPPFGASSSKDVADMLEEPSAGPSILRLTSPSQTAPKKEKKSAAAPAPAETKKQRQNRKKAEEKKAAREVEEAERRKLEEQQRRTARIAEGRAAKDGQAFLAANPPSKPVWTGSTPAADGEKAAVPQGDLLDTFDATPKSKVVNGAGSTTEAMSAYEEDQLRAISESEKQEDSWQSVSSKKNKKNAAISKNENVPAQENVSAKPIVDNSKPKAKEM